MFGVVVVVDTNVLVSAIGGRGASREVVRACLRGCLQLLVGAALFVEYESVLARDELFVRSALTAREREALFDAFLSVCRWVRIYFLWRPNLRDEADNHLVELAIAGGAEAIVTKNTRDFKNASLQFPGLRILRPEDLVEEVS